MTRVGVLGGGQLARMMALAGAPLDVALTTVDPAESAPASVAARSLVAGLEDPHAWAALVGCDVVTFEVEHVPLAALRWLAERVALRPGMKSVEVAGDRLHEKRFLASLGIPTAPFWAVEGPDDAADAFAHAGSGILKTRTHGYDGRGQRRVQSEEALRGASSELGRPCVYEGFVPFQRELSILGVRGVDGEKRFWPLVENVHDSGILRTSTAPAEVDQTLTHSARGIASAILDALDYVGVLCVELFDTDVGLVANEIAPRVHNSGHWTIEGSTTSQFENHLRAILGWPLGDTSARGSVHMINCVGALPPLRPVLEVPGAHLHLYGKVPRPARKVGHVTLTSEDPALRQRLSGLVPFELYWLK